MNYSVTEIAGDAGLTESGRLGTCAPKGPGVASHKPLMRTAPITSPASPAVSATVLDRLQEHTPFIMREAKKWAARNPTVDLDDLLQEGRIAVVLADQRYEKGRGAKFLTYLAYWIKQRMALCCVKSPTVHGPQHTFGGVTNISLSTPAGDDDDATVADTLGSSEDVRLQVIANEVIATARKILTPKELRVLEAVFFEGKTQVDIGLEWGVSHSRIWQLQRNALSKLRRKLT